MPNEKSIGGQPVRCRCPKCRKYHKAKITIESEEDGAHAITVEYTGRGTPWKYCHACKIRLGMLPSKMFPRLDYDTIEGKL